MSLATPPTNIDYYPKGAAKALFTCHAPEVLICGPAGTGKSRVALELLHLRLLKYDGARALACRKTMKSLTDTGLVTYRKKIKPHLDGVTFFGGSQQEPAQFRYPNGSRLMMGGLDNPTKTLSSEYDVVYVQQAEELTEDDWEMLTRSLRWNVMPFQQILADCNPDKPDHWLKRRADSGNLLLLESRHEDNPMLFLDGEWTSFGAKYIARLDALTGTRKERLRYGRWAAAEGIVYEEYDRAIHLIDAAPQARTHIAAVDWGFTNAGVITVYAIDGDGRMYLVHEVYQSRKLIDWWIEQAWKIENKYHPTVYVCDPSEPAYIAAFQGSGLYRRVEPAFNAITPGIHAVQERLQVAPDGKPRLMLCRDTLTRRDEELAEAGKPYSTDQEMDSYIWPKSADGKPLKEIPIDENNHGLDTLRYAVAYVDKVGEEPRRPVETAPPFVQAGSNRWGET